MCVCVCVCVCLSLCVCSDCQYSRASFACKALVVVNKRSRTAKKTSCTSESERRGFVCVIVSITITSFSRSLPPGVGLSLGAPTCRPKARQTQTRHRNDMPRLPQPSARSARHPNSSSYRAGLCLWSATSSRSNPPSLREVATEKCQSVRSYDYSSHEPPDAYERFILECSSGLRDARNSTSSQAQQKGKERRRKIK